MPRKSLEHAPQQLVDTWFALEEAGENHFVRLDKNRIEEVAEASPLVTIEDPDLPPTTPDWRTPVHEEDNRRYALQTTLTGVINYAFQKPKEKGGNWEYNGWGDSFGLHLRTKELFGSKDDITSDDIYPYTTDEGMRLYLPGVPHLRSRARLLRQFAKGLEQEYDGSIQQLLDSSLDSNGNMLAFNNGDGLVERLADEETFGQAFADHSTIDGVDVNYLKLAQLTPLLIHDRALTSGGEIPVLTDVEKLGTINDYQIPRSHRLMGTFVVRQNLAKKIDNWKLIPRDSREENELRLACAAGTTMIKSYINEQRAQHGLAPITIAPLDAWQWFMGRELDQENKVYPHRTTTTTY